MTIRLARAEDLPAIVDIYNQAIRMRCATGDLVELAWQDRRQWLDEHLLDRHPLWVAIAEDGSIEGWCCLSAWRPGRQALRFTIEISYYVHENHRRSGIGRAMVAHGMEQAKLLGYRTVLALLLEINLASIALLEQFGFSLWGNLPAAAEIDGRECSHLIYGRKISSVAVEAGSAGEIKDCWT